MAEIEFYESDGITLITDETWDTLLAGTTSAGRKFYFKNTDVRTWRTVQLSIVPVADNDGYTIVEISADGSSWATTPFTVGDVAPSDLVEFHQRLVTTGGMPNAGNPRLWDIGILETG